MSDKDGNETDNREKFLNAQERNSAFLSLQFIKDHMVLCENLVVIYQGISQDPALIEDYQALD